MYTKSGHSLRNGNVVLAMAVVAETSTTNVITNPYFHPQSYAVKKILYYFDHLIPSRLKSSYPSFLMGAI